MAATENKMLRSAVTGHADEVVSPSEEAGEGCGKRNLPGRGEPQGRADHVLLGDISFEEALRKLFGKEFRAGRVLHVAVEHDNVGAQRAELLDRLAEGVPGGDGLAQPIVRLDPLDGRGAARRVLPDTARLDLWKRADVAELGERLLHLLGRERLAMPAAGALEERYALSFLGAGDDGGGYI